MREDPVVPRLRGWRPLGAHVEAALYAMVLSALPSAPRRAADVRLGDMELDQYGTKYAIVDGPGYVRIIGAGVDCCFGTVDDEWGTYYDVLVVCENQRPR